MRIVSQFKVLLARKAMREQRTISLRAVSRESGIAISLVYGLANDSWASLPRASITAICTYLGCTLSELLVEEPAEPL